MNAGLSSFPSASILVSSVLEGCCSCLLMHLRSCCGQSRQLELRHSQKTIADQKVLILKLEQELQVGSSHARAAASAPSTPSHHDAQLSHNMQLLAAVGKAFSPSHRARQVATSWRQLCRPLDGKESLCVYFGYSWRRQCRFHGPWPGRGSEW